MPQNSTFLNITFTDSDHLSDTVKDWNIDFKQIDTGSFKYNLKQVVTPNSNITHSYCNRQLDQRGSTPKGFTTFGLITNESTKVIWRGQERNNKSILIFPESGELDAISYEGFSVYTLSFSNELLYSLSDKLKLEGLEQVINKPNVLQTDNTTYNNLNNSLLTLFNNAGNTDQSEEVDSTIPALFAFSLTKSTSKEDIPSYSSRLGAIHKVRDFINEFPWKRLNIVDLCTITGVSKRTIQYAFREYFGVTPMQYLKNFRLNGVRTEILNRKGDITYIANKWGFPHVGYFAADYKKLFGELPSETKKDRLIIYNQSIQELP